MEGRNCMKDERQMEKNLNIITDTVAAYYKYYTSDEVDKME